MCMCIYLRQVLAFYYIYASNIAIENLVQTYSFRPEEMRLPGEGT